MLACDFVSLSVVPGLSVLLPTGDRLVVSQTCICEIENDLLESVRRDFQRVVRAYVCSAADAGVFSETDSGQQDCDTV